MQGLHVFLVGNTIFANGIEELLLNCKAVSQLESVSSVADILHFVDHCSPDVLFFVDADSEVLCEGPTYLSVYLDIPVICMSHENMTMKLTVTTQSSARLWSLLQALVTLRSA